MTAQISDSVRYRGKEYSIAGQNGGVLFDPAAHGLKPVGRCTACWRGFVCAYAVDDGRLLLDSVSLYLDDPAPPLFGVPPRQDQDKYLYFSAVYEGLNHWVPYTGGLLLAACFIEEMYVHMGFHPAWKYREVRELVFRDGALAQEFDRSTRMAELRGELGDRLLQPDIGADPTDIARRIGKCFSQEYEW